MSGARRPRSLQRGRLSTSRRTFVSRLAAVGLATPFGVRTTSALAPTTTAPLTVPPTATLTTTPTAISSGRFEPWIEVDAQAIRANVATLARLAGGRPITAVIKNNGYGLGLKEVGRVLDTAPEVKALGVVKVAEALALREAGIRKPILLLALFDDADGAALVRAGITLSLCVPDIGARVARAIARAGKTTSGQCHGQCYVDTGMSRMGLPYHTAAPIIRDLARLRGLTITGTFTELTEDPAFDVEQVRRLSALAAELKASGLATGPLHAASSHAVFNHPATLLDAVRPGISLFGAYPSDDGSERTIAPLVVALRLKARVVRVERLRAGDTVSYGRHFKAEEPTWVATIPMGHADGYPRRAVHGGAVVIGGRTFPAIGAVSASHTIVNLGPTTTVHVGDVVTLLGPDAPAIHPNALATATDTSVYDVLMHLSPALPRVVG